MHHSTKTTPTCPIPKETIDLPINLRPLVPGPYSYSYIVDHSKQVLLYPYTYYIYGIIIIIIYVAKEAYMNQTSVQDCFPPQENSTSFVINYLVLLIILFS